MMIPCRKNTNHHLDKLQREDGLGSCKRQRFVPATKDSINRGVCLPNGSIKPTLHHFFMDDDIYCGIIDLYCIWQAVATLIEAIYILLGELDLMAPQDPVSFEKLTVMPISYSSRILGQIINTRPMDVKTPLPLQSLSPKGHRIHHGEARSHCVHSTLIALPPTRPIHGSGHLPQNPLQPPTLDKKAVLHVAQIAMGP